MANMSGDRDEVVPACPLHGIVHDGDDFHPWCDDVGVEHTWGPWHFAQVGTHEIRFCGRCGGMEQQEVTG